MRRWIALPLLVVGLFGAADAAPPSKPNFLFIFVDDQAWNGTSVAMLPGDDNSRTTTFRMPNLDRLAAEGMVFSQGYAAHPKCECSRAALLMGRSTTSLNATDKNSRRWNAPVSDSLANTLKRANPSYRAAHFGKWQWPQTPESMGFDASDGITMNEDGDTQDPNDPKQSFGITRRAQAYMGQQVKTGHPFYLQLSYYAVHNKPQALATTLRKYESLGNRSLALQAAMTEDLDNCIGDLLKALDRLSITKDTYVIYMADNGMRSEALKGGKSLLDEGGLRVPLIVHGPGIQAGGYCHVPAVGYDVFPTVLDFAAPGSLLPKGIEGGSRKSVLLNAGTGQISRPIDRLVFHHDVEVEHPQSALRQGNLKLLHYWDTKQNFLYDLSADLGERKNLAQEQPDMVARLLRELIVHVRAGLGEEKFAALESGKYQAASGSGSKGKDARSKGKGRTGETKGQPFE